MKTTKLQKSMLLVMWIMTLAILFDENIIKNMMLLVIGAGVGRWIMED